MGAFTQMGKKSVLFYKHILWQMISLQIKKGLQTGSFEVASFTLCFSPDALCDPVGLE